MAAIFSKKGDLSCRNVFHSNEHIQLEIGQIGMRNVHPKGSMSFALKLGQNWQE